PGAGTPGGDRGGAPRTGERGGRPGAAGAGGAGRRRRGGRGAERSRRRVDSGAARRGAVRRPCRPAQPRPRPDLPGGLELYRERLVGFRLVREQLGLEQRLLRWWLVRLWF